MKFTTDIIHHVGLIVTDRPRSEAFYMGILGFERHHKISSWLKINETNTIHLINIAEAGSDNSIYHRIQHVALQVDSLTKVVEVLMSNGQKPFQMDFEGKVRDIPSASDTLEYGIGTVFVRDPDGNLIEFLQIGKGIFAAEADPPTAS